MSASAMHRATLIVIDIDGGEHLSACLRSIAAQALLPERVIVWDNGSRVPTSERVPAQPYRLDVLRSDRNVGFTGAINGAMREVNSPIVGWVNNDVVLDPAWLDELSTVLRRDDRIGAVQSIIVREDGRVDGAGIAVENGRFVQAGHLSPTRGSFPPPWGISGTAALFRTAALREVALTGDLILHPAFFAYYEDVELSARLRRGGWRLDLADAVLATHAGSASAAKLPVPRERLRARNRYFVHRLHPEAGTLSGLLSEDLRRGAGLLFRGRIRTGWDLFRGVVEGLSVPVLPHLWP